MPENPALICGRLCAGCDYTCPKTCTDCPWDCGCDYCPCEDAWQECAACLDADENHRFCGICADNPVCPVCKTPWGEAEVTPPCCATEPAAP